jgi:hypothetical protein
MHEVIVVAISVSTLEDSPVDSCGLRDGAAYSLSSISGALCLAVIAFLREQWDWDAATYSLLSISGSLVLQSFTLVFTVHRQQSDASAYSSSSISGALCLEVIYLVFTVHRQQSDAAAYSSSSISGPLSIYCLSRIVGCCRL